jgi:hypothetical protein
MARYAIIQDGAVVNVAEAGADFAAAQGWVAAEHAGIGWLWDGERFTPPSPPALTVADFEAALDAHLDAKAQERRYTDRFTCALRAGFPGPYQAEGAAFAAWMDQCNAQAYALLMAVQSGERPAPASVQEFVGGLPELEWPS